MEFIEAKINPNSTLKMLSKRWRRDPKIWRKIAYKRPKIANPYSPASQHTWYGRATSHGQAVPHCWPACAGWPLGCMARAPSCSLVSCLFRACCPPFCSSWCSWFPWSSNLPWTYFWSPLFHRNTMISLEMKTKRNLGTIWIEGR